MLLQELTAPRSPSINRNKELHCEADATAVAASQPAAHELTAAAAGPTTSDTCTAVELHTTTTNLADADQLQTDQCPASQESGTAAAPPSRVDSGVLNHSSNPTAGSNHSAGCNHDSNDRHCSGAAPACELVKLVACGMASEATVAVASFTESEVSTAVGAITPMTVNGASTALILSNAAMDGQLQEQPTASTSAQVIVSQGLWRQSVEDFLSAWPQVCQVLDDNDHSTRDQFVTALLGCLQQLHDAAVAPLREELQKVEACRMNAQGQQQ